MDSKRFDRARGAERPAELDLVESFAQGRVNRRDFIRRGTAVGLSVPFMGAVLAACGGDDDDTSTTDASTGTDAATGDTSGETAAGGTIRVASQKPAGPLDPVGMQDLGSYGIVAQCFEFLCTLGDNDIGPGLAESWEPNEDGSVWTFNLRQGVKWHDGTDFTAADVAATMDRLVEFGNSALKGVIEAGAVDTSDPTKAVFTLVSPNGNFPYLVSLYNAQSVITPVAFTTGSTLDGSPNGTGPFKFVAEKYDPATGATFERNDDWWGGKTALDGSVWSFFDDEGTMVTATSAGEVDCIVQFQVNGGDALFNDENFNVLGMRAATHRQIWMRVDEGQFADKRVRQALALTIDREQLIETLFKGKADIGNDHVIAPLYPFFDDSVPQRERDVDAAKALLEEAGATGLTATLHFGELQEIPELAQLIKQQAADAGITLELAGESLDTFYGAQWCPAEPAEPPCSGAAELGIVDYGHRATPDVYLNAALSTNGIWNSSQYASADFDAAFKTYQEAVGVDAQKAACKTIEEILNDEVPIIVPYFYNYISGFTKQFTGVRVSALGQLFLDQAAAV
ncbi:MAG: ABC transporter substrate-binding protein [Acidimicrobiia bacterium]